jgi:hypothetical protein
MRDYEQYHQSVFKSVGLLANLGKSFWRDARPSYNAIPAVGQAEFELLRTSGSVSSTSFTSATDLLSVLNEQYATGSRDWNTKDERSGFIHGACGAIQGANWV